MKFEIIDLINAGKIDKASSFLNNESFLPEGLEKWAYKSQNLGIYTLLAQRLINKNTIEDHGRAALLLSSSLCSYKGAYSLALYHARQVLFMDPNNIEHKRFLILFHDIPENLIKRDEAIQIAKEVLSIDPACGVSRQVLQKYQIMAKN